MKENFKHPHTFFDSYSKDNSNQVSKNKRQKNFFEIFSNLNIVEKEKLLKGENLDIISELETYSGNISTNQLRNIDYSKFSNHVFFDSAVHKVKYAFDEIVKFPYDANESDYLSYITNIDGYTKYLLENVYPKYTGSILFNGTSKVIIKDKKGFLLNDFSEKTYSEGSLSPNSTQGYTFSFHLKTPTSFNNNAKQTLFKKTRTSTNSIDEGFFCYIEQNDSDTEKCNLCFGIKNEDINIPLVSHTTLDKDASYYVNIVVKNNNTTEILFYVDSVKAESVSKTSSFFYENFSNNFAKKDIEFVAGSGESETFSLDINTVVTLNNFETNMDEFIFFNKVREESEIQLHKDTNIFKDNSVLLYLKFNEIGGTHQNSALVIDSSGNKLHGVLKNLSDAIILDTTSFKDSPLLTKEDLTKNPIILGSVQSIQDKRNELVVQANTFDAGNSNIIFNMIPSHYFTNSSNLERKADFIDVSFDDQNNGEKIAELGDIQNTHITQICLIWARFFDQLKLYVDALSGMFNLDYDSVNRQEFVNSQMKMLCKIYGFDFTEIDLNRTIEKSERKNVSFDDVVEETGVVKLQNLIWKKILINSQDIIRSKGTLNSINSFINSLGFDLKKFVNIEEKSYKNYVNLTSSFENLSQEIKALSFHKFRKNNVAYDPNDIVINHPKLSINNFRTETSDIQNPSDGFIGDGTVELFFDFNKNIYKDHINKNETPFSDKQVIAQFVSNDFSKDYCFCVLYMDFTNGKNQKSKFCDLVLEVTPKSVDDIATLNNNKKIVKIENINAFDVSHYVSISFKDLGESVQELSLAYNTLGDVKDQNRISRKKSTYTYSNSDSLFHNNSFNIVVGKEKYTNAQPYSLILSDDTRIFESNLYNIKLWKKSLSDSEMLRHSQDIMNIGEDSINIKISNLISSFYFNDVSHTFSLANNIEIKTPNSFSNYIDINVNNEELNSCILTLNFDDSNLIKNPFNVAKVIRKTKSGSIDKIDNNNLNRVRILSFQDEENKAAYDNFEIYPIHETPFEYDSYKSDFIGVSVSSSKIINDAIERLLLNIETVTDIISNNMQSYQYSYLDIDALRKDFFESYKDNDYFNYDSLNNIFKYFDNIMNNVLYTLIPNGITFQGFNLVYESHILERSKYLHKNKESNIAVQSTENYSQTKFDPCGRINKRKSSYNNARLYKVYEE